MDDVQLKKKVQLKQKSTAPAVTLKRKGEATPGVTLKKKMSEDAAGVATAATTAAVAAAVAAQAASTATSSTGQVPPVASDKPTAGAKLVKGPAKAATGANGAGLTSSDARIKTAGNTNPANSNSGDKKRGKTWAWVLGVAAIAGLAFGGYKLATDNNSKAPSNIVEDNTASEEKNIGEEYTADKSISQNGVGKTEEDASSTDGHDSTSGNVENEINSSSTNREVSASGTDNTTESASQSSEARGNNFKESSIGENNLAMGGKSGENKSDSSHDGFDSSVTSSDVNSTTSGYAVVKSVSESQAVCLFAFDSSIVGENEVLNRLANIAKTSDKKIVINAYADEVGTDEYNQALSQRRANAVKDYFIKRGVNAVIISAKGNGETTQYTTHAENRRADITIQ